MPKALSIHPWFSAALNHEFYYFKILGLGPSHCPIKHPF